MKQRTLKILTDGQNRDLWKLAQSTLKERRSGKPPVVDSTEFMKHLSTKPEHCFTPDLFELQGDEIFREAYKKLSRRSNAQRLPEWLGCL